MNNYLKSLYKLNLTIAVVFIHLRYLSNNLTYPARQNRCQFSLRSILVYDPEADTCTTSPI